VSVDEVELCTVKERSDIAIGDICRQFECSCSLHVTECTNFFYNLVIKNTQLICCAVDCM
jgi:hypothetical protein